MGIFDELKSPAPKNFFSKGKGNLISKCIITKKCLLTCTNKAIAGAIWPDLNLTDSIFLNLGQKVCNRDKFSEINLALPSQDTSTFYSTMGEIPCTRHL